MSATSAANEKGECFVTSQRFTGNLQGANCVSLSRGEQARISPSGDPATSLLQMHTL